MPSFQKKISIDRAEVRKNVKNWDSLSPRHLDLSNAKKRRDCLGQSLEFENSREYFFRCL